MAKPAIMGAYTLAFAAFSSELEQRNGKLITPYGRFMAPRDDIIKEIEAGDGGNGYKLFEWCDKQIAPFI
jgi:retinol dehydrogenase 12